MGCTKSFSGLCGPRTTSAVAVEGPISMGRARRCGLRTMSMHTLLAMRYSQVRSDGAPLEAVDGARHAQTMVSCTASSASKPAPSMR